MANYIVNNKNILKDRHYLLLANQAGHWFNISPNRLNEYKERYIDDFCIILYRSGSHDDAYVMPFKAIKRLFSERSLMIASGGSSRWVGSIRNDQLNIRREDSTVLVSQYYNEFELLK